MQLIIELQDIYGKKKKIYMAKIIGSTGLIDKFITYERG